MADMNPQMMSSMLQFLGNTMGTGAHGSYQGRYNMQAPTGEGFLNLAGAGGQLGGDAGATVGSMVQMLGMYGMLGPDVSSLMSRLQSHRGVDPLRMAHERQIMQSQMSLQYGVTGDSVSRALGTSGPMSNMIAGALPMMSMVMPELRGLVDVVTPGALTTGASDLTSALAMQDMMQRVNPTKTEAMKTAFNRYTMDEKNGFRRNDRTGGMNLDDFAQVVRFNQDQGIRDNSFLRDPAEREKARGEARDYIQERYRRENKGASLSDAELSKRVDADLEQTALVRGATGNADLARRVKYAIGAQNTGEALNFMAEAGIAIRGGGDEQTNAKEKRAMEEAVTRIEALAKAAGTTSQELTNVGRAVQQRYGGSLMSAMDSAGRAQAAGRYGVSMGMSTLDADDLSKRTLEYDQLSQQTGRGNVLRAAAMMSSTDPKIAALLKTAYGSDQEAGAKAIDELNEIVGNSEMGRKLTSSAASDPTARAFQDRRKTQVLNEMGLNEAHGKLNEMRAAWNADMAGAGVDTARQELMKELQGMTKQQRAALATSTSGAYAALLQKYSEKGRNVGDADIRSDIARAIALDSGVETGKNVEEYVTSRNAIEDTANKSGQSIMQALKASDSKTPMLKRLEAAAEAAGIMSNPERQKLAELAEAGRLDETSVRLISLRNATNRESSMSGDAKADASKVFDELENLRQSAYGATADQQKELREKFEGLAKEKRISVEWQDLEKDAKKTSSSDGGSGKPSTAQGGQTVKVGGEVMVTINVTESGNVATTTQTSAKQTQGDVAIRVKQAKTRGAS